MASRIIEIEAGGPGIDVDENRNVTEEAHRDDGSGGGVRRNHNFTAGRQIDGEEHRHEGAGPIDVRFYVRRVEVVLHLFFEERNLAIRFVAVQQLEDHPLFLFAIMRPLRYLSLTVGGDCYGFGPARYSQGLDGWASGRDAGGERGCARSNERSACGLVWHGILLV